MGYMGLNHWEESDNASDFKFTIQEKLSKSLNSLIKKELKDKANEYNTPGEVNVALLIEDGVIPVHFIDQENRENILDSLKDSIKGIKKYRKIDNSSNTTMHLNAYQRMLKFCKKEFDKKHNNE